MKRHNSFVKKALSLTLSLTLASSVFGMAFNISASADASCEDIVKMAAQNYIKANKNESNKDNLLKAVNDSLSENGFDDTATYDDVYIKYSVPSATDTDLSSYKINMTGSDGAVSAKFKVGEKQIDFSTAFSQEKEVIKTDVVAVLGGENSDKLVTDSDGNVIGCNSSVDKIVIPSSSGAVMGAVDFSTYPLMNNVKVVVQEDTGKNMVAKSYNGNWDSLVALSLFDGQNFCWAGRDPFISASVTDLKSLKYLRLPISGATYHGWDTGSRNPFLENVVVTKSQTYGWECFCYTNVREFVLSEFSSYKGQYHVAALDGPTSFKKGYASNTNVTEITTPVTFSHISALAIAALNEELENGIDVETAVTNAKAKLVKSSWSDDCATYIEGITIANVSNTSTDTKSNLQFAISNDTDSMTFDYVGAKALKNIIMSYELDPTFAPDVTEYSVTVPGSVSSLDMDIVVANGATVASIENNENFVPGKVTDVKINVTNNSGVNVIYTIKVTREASYDGSEELKAAAKEYILNNRNDVTKEGLLEAVDEVALDTVTLADNDFYIKHSVPGVSDKMADGSINDYPLNIKGSDGAVSAIFEVSGVRVGVVVPFTHEEEIINVKKIDVLSTDNSNFTFNADGNAVTYTGSADKIVIPADFDGTIAELTDNTNADKVKVVVVNNDATLTKNAFAGWESLKAIQFNSTTKGLKLFGADVSGQFMDCTNLKYVKLPKSIDRNGGSGAWYVSFGNNTFKNCTSLENFVMSENGTGDRLGVYYSALTYTAIREFIFPKNWNFSFDNYLHSTCLETGTVNITVDSTVMTFAHASALAAAKANEYNNSSLDKSGMIDAMKSVVTGTNNSSEVLSSMGFVESENAISIVSGTNEVSLELSKRIDGDINDNGAVNSEDLIMIKKALLDCGIMYNSMDANNDGKVSVADMIKIKKSAASFRETGKDFF